MTTSLVFLSDLPLRSIGMGDKAPEDCNPFMESINPVDPFPVDVPPNPPAAKSNPFLWKIEKMQQRKCRMIRIVQTRPTCAFGGQVMWFEERGKPEHLDDAADAVEISITDRK